MRTFEYRLYPTRDQQARLMACLSETRLLYNEMLERTKAHYEQTGTFLFRYDLCMQFAGRSGEYVPASTVQMLADRLDKALRRYLEAKAKGQLVGFPRFKAANRWRSIDLRQFGVGCDFRLSDDHRFLQVRAKLGKYIKIKLHRPLEGKPKTAHLVRRADEHWYVLIVCETSPQEEIERVHNNQSMCEHEAIGLDVGLKVFLADSEGHTVPNPRYYRASQKVLRRKQRTLSRRKQGSHRRRKAARNVAKTHLKINRQRRDFLFKTAKRYAKGYRRVCVEDLHIDAMVHHPRLAKSILDASWGMFLDILADKAERAGHEVVRVAPQYTTQRCSQCGERVLKSLSVRTHRCPNCGYIADRDVNAAQNILKAGAQPSGTVSDSSPSEPRSRCL